MQQKLRLCTGRAAVGPGSSSSSECGIATGAPINARRFSASEGPDRFGARRFRSRSLTTASPLFEALAQDLTVGATAASSSSDSPELE